MFEKVLIIGASRGLGKSVAEFIPSHLPDTKSLWLSSRKIESAPTLNGERLPADMALREDQERIAALIGRENFDLIIYSAGGGPHGEFLKKDWKDHAWSLEVGLLAPMALSLSWLKSRNPGHEGRFVIVGSRIAESQPDPLSASYAAGKHGLLGFVSSLQPELEKNQNKVWLFSPGYMDSAMLPKNAPVRHDGSKLMTTDTAAQALLRWIKKDGPWHRILN